MRKSKLCLFVLPNKTLNNSDKSTIEYKVMKEALNKWSKLLTKRFLTKVVFLESELVNKANENLFEGFSYLTALSKADKVFADSLCDLEDKPENPKMVTDPSVDRIISEVCKRHQPKQTADKEEYRINRLYILNKRVADIIKEAADEFPVVIDLSFDKTKAKKHMFGDGKFKVYINPHDGTEEVYYGGMLLTSEAVIEQVLEVL